jgi:cysteinyl-tRNA synthetase
LIDSGHAYESGGSVYFKTDSYEKYGSLSGRKPEDMKSSDGKYTDDKKNISDFALWKKDEKFGWKSPWGTGRPGWHIECSAISRKFLGEQFDIHGGGLDLIFPHHENEAAQSEALTGRNPVNFWVHNGMVNLKGDKMAKSTGNFFLLKDLLQNFNAEIVRMYLLTTGYRQVLNFDSAELSDTKKAFNKLCEFKKELYQIAGKPTLDAVDIDRENFAVPAAITEELNNDLNTSAAIGEVFKTVNALTEKMFKDSFSPENPLPENFSPEDIKEGLGAIYVMENLMGIDLNIKHDIDRDRVEKLLEERRGLRKDKKYLEADRIRERLLQEGIQIKDTPAGVKWFKK